jgi:hypothetical protein
LGHDGDSGRGRALVGHGRAEVVGAAIQAESSSHAFFRDFALSRFRDPRRKFRAEIRRSI